MDLRFSLFQLVWKITAKEGAGSDSEQTVPCVERKTKSKLEMQQINKNKETLSSNFWFSNFKTKDLALFSYITGYLGC